MCPVWRRGVAYCVAMAVARILAVSYTTAGGGRLINGDGPCIVSVAAGLPAAVAAGPAAAAAIGQRRGGGGIDGGAQSAMPGGGDGGIGGGQRRRNLAWWQW